MNLVLTVIGDDKPGLVEALSQVIVNHAGNWQESSMSQLAGKFAGILRVRVPDENSDALIRELQGLSEQLKVIVEKAADQAATVPQTIALHLVGNDRPGIVREISHALTGLGVNVEQLVTECVPAPMSSEMLFKADARLRVPASLGSEQLQQEIERLADDLIVEIQLGDD